MIISIWNNLYKMNGIVSSETISGGIGKIDGHRSRINKYTKSIKKRRCHITLKTYKADNI